MSCDIAGNFYEVDPGTAKLGSRHPRKVHEIVNEFGHSLSQRAKVC
jgi:hypothetical protein